jgi:hypothetical protein
MSWFTFYKLLRKYDGDINKASPNELRCADRANPGNPFAALRMAREKYQAEREREELEAQSDSRQGEKAQLQAFEMSRGCGR